MSNIELGKGLTLEAQVGIQIARIEQAIQGNDLPTLTSAAFELAVAEALIAADQGRLTNTAYVQGVLGEVRRDPLLYVPEELRGRARAIMRPPQTEEEPAA